MRHFVITIPVDENLEDFIKQLGYELLAKRVDIAQTLSSGELPDFNVVNEDEGIEYSFGLELTSDDEVTA